LTTPIINIGSGLAPAGAILFRAASTIAFAAAMSALWETAMLISESRFSSADGLCAIAQMGTLSEAAMAIATTKRRDAASPDMYFLIFSSSDCHALCAHTLPLNSNHEQQKESSFVWNYCRGGGGSGVTLRESGLSVIAMLKGSGLTVDAARGDCDGIPVESIHGPIDAQISAAPLSGHCFVRSWLSLSLEGAEAIPSMPPIGISDAMAERSSHPAKAAASPGKSVMVERPRRRRARNRRMN
jgi:hypothetical protein